MGQQADASTAWESDDLGEGVDSSGFVPAGRADIERLASGELSQQEYLDLCVTRATAHLEGQVSEERLEAMQTILRAELEEDPVLADLARRAAAS